jgi:hypothetical protein
LEAIVGGEFWTPQTIAAFSGFGGVVIGALISWSVQAHLLGKRIKADEQLAERKFEFDKDLARRKFDLDRSRLIHKRRFELAEALLADAYRFRGLMAFGRSPLSYGNEGETRQSDGCEPADIKRIRDKYFIPIERLQNQS